MTRAVTIAFCLAALLAALYAFFSLSAFDARGGQTAPLYCARRHDPYGTAALRDLLRESGVETRFLKNHRLPTGASGTLIQVLPVPEPCVVGSCASCRGSRSRVKTESLREWLQAGNRVVQLTREQTLLMADLGVGLGPGLADHEERARLEERQRRGFAPDRLRESLVPADWTAFAKRTLFPGEASVKRLELRLPVSFAPRGKTATWRPLATRGDVVVAVEIPVGEGGVVLVGAPTPALNHTLGDGGNLEFMLALAGRAPVYLDEWSHGLGHSGTVVGLMRKLGLLPLVVQAAVVFAFYLWSLRGRACAEPRAPEEARSVTDQIHALGNLYADALSDAELRRRVRAEAVRCAAEALRLSPAAFREWKVSLPPDDVARVNAIRTAADRLASAKRLPKLVPALCVALNLSHDFLREKAHDRHRREPGA